MTVSFTFDSTIINTTAVVVGEDLYRSGRKISTHFDLTDEAQAVYYPEIGTTLKDATTEEHISLASEHTVNVDTISYESLVKGKTYTYQVRAFNGSTYGPWSNVMTLKPPVDTPTVTAFYKYSSSRLRATWSSVQGAAYYRVAYKKSGGSWQYQNVSGTQIDFTNPTANSTYYFSVYAVGENGTSSDWSPDYYVYT